MLQGRISAISGSFGFIAAEPRDVFFPSSSVEWASFGELAAGQEVEYELSSGPAPLHVGYKGGPQAVTVRPIFVPVEASVESALEE